MNSQQQARRTRILVVDDHPIFRAGLSALLADEADMQIVGEASTGVEAITQYEALRPDITLMDLQLPQMDGMTAFIQIRKTHLSARVIIITSNGGDVMAQRALQAGAQGYLLKGAVRVELVDAIRAVRCGMRRVSSDVEEQLVQHMGDDILSNRETEVLRLVAEGHTDRKVAQILEISEDTAKGHIKSILGKLRAANRTHAVTLGLTRGIIQLWRPDLPKRGAERLGQRLS